MINVNEPVENKNDGYKYFFGWEGGSPLFPYGECATEGNDCVSIDSAKIMKIEKKLILFTQIQISKPFQYHILINTKLSLQNHLFMKIIFFKLQLHFSTENLVKPTK